jgi:hypothetical protein
MTVIAGTDGPEIAAILDARTRLPMRSIEPAVNDRCSDLLIIATIRLLSDLSSVS